MAARTLTNRYKSIKMAGRFAVPAASALLISPNGGELEKVRQKSTLFSGILFVSQIAFIKHRHSPAEDWTVRVLVDNGNKCTWPSTSS